MLCPICKKPVDDSERGKPHSAYPFCSERCRLVDLGRWLGGKYQIPSRPGDDEEDLEPPAIEPPPPPPSPQDDAPDR